MIIFGKILEMERFLSQCAKYIYEKHADEMAEICVVFPNRRSGVFFTSYMQKCVVSPIVSPQVITINEMFTNLAAFQVGEKLQLISILYSVFKKHTQTKETFDEFYFWGEILLADFNDVDRYLVNAKDLFRNISDLKEIESLFDYLTDEQKRALEYFWGSVAVTDKKEFQNKYLKIWEKLFPVYQEFKEILEREKLAFGGMNARKVIEVLKENAVDFQYKKYYFIGLNALNSCEKELFKYLERKKLAAFLWDYDNFYLKDDKNEAGWFMRENVIQYPAPEDFVFNFDLFQEKKEIKIVAVSSVYGQTQEIPNFLNEISPNFKPEFDNTAIVLADESLLYSALTSIPESIEKINVTMGYPVKSSVVYGFLLLLVQLLKNKKLNKEKKLTMYYRFVTDVLNHQLLSGIERQKVYAYVSEIKRKNRIAIELEEINFSDFHKLIFNIPQEVEEYSNYFLAILKEFYKFLNVSGVENKMLLELIYSVYTAIERLNSVIKNVQLNGKTAISDAVYFRLFNQFLGQESVAFEGEPLSGLQVMGILETRCLDFKNLIILGLNENKWPRVFTAPSFIPHNIRKGFGLPGIDEQDAMYAYYFYRLIQRAENVTATYSVVKEGISTGELSRYGYQLKYDSAKIIKFENLNFTFASEPAKPIIVKSSEEKIKDFLTRINSEHPLSPSALNVYLQCSLRFYFRYFMQLPEPDEVKDEIDSPVFGNIFHETIEALYKPFVGKEISSADIESIQKNIIKIENELTKAIAKHYFKEKSVGKRTVKLEGKTLLIFENSKTFLRQLLEIDKQNTPFEIVALEGQYKSSLEIEIDGEKTSVFVGGKIDRVDRKKENYRVLDYKTGRVETLAFSQVGQLFEHDVEKSKKEILQALVYTLVLSDNLNRNTQIQPTIYSLREFFKDTFSPYLQFNKQDFNWGDIREEFENQLKKLIEEIFSKDTTFVQTQHDKKCQYCPYNKICQRF